MHALHFWIGKWDVSQNGQVVGTNTIESTLDGCAILEHWRDVKGGEGTSLFYFNKSENRWKQVWITNQSLKIGGTKEKIEDVDYTASGRIRFVGMDRTTLTREADGKVRHLGHDFRRRLSTQLIASGLRLQLIARSCGRRAAAADRQQ
jgi:hypothetical protein